MIGTRVADRYDIEAQIGIGGMGIVYRAHDTRLRRHVALKVIAPHLVQQEAARSQFLREAQALAGLMHPNIVTVFDLSEDDSTQTVFIVMELLRGSSLRHCMAESGRPLFSQVALPLCRALEAAHARGVLHRDIKPENVFVCDDGTIKLMDFGLARLLTANTRSQASILAGTLAYMAPEQLKGERTDFRADLYSLGILFYEYLSGATPFAADNPGAILLKHLTEAAPSLQSRIPDISAELDGVILRLLEKDPAGRFDSATLLREALEHPAAEGNVAVAYDADRTVLAPPNHSATTVFVPPTNNTPTPVLLTQPNLQLAPPVAIYPGRRVRPTFLAGGVVCFSVAALLLFGPVQRHFASANGNETVSTTKRIATPVAASGSLTQQANAVPVLPSVAAQLPNYQKKIETSQAHTSAELDILIKQQEQTRSEVERLEKLLAREAAKRQVAETQAALARRAAAETPGIKSAAPQKPLLNPLPAVVPDALVKIAALHPHDPFEFRTKQVTRTADGTLDVQVHNSRACHLYLYQLQENNNQAVLIPNAERSLSGTPQHNVFTEIGLRVEGAIDSQTKLLLLASGNPLVGLPSRFPLPSLPRHSASDVSIDRRFALLHDYRDQIVTTMQAYRVQSDGKNVQQDDIIVRFLRYKPTPEGTAPVAEPPVHRKFGMNESHRFGTRATQTASLPVELFL